MKRTFLTCLFVLCFSLVGHAANARYYYGAWWNTKINKRLVAFKNAGQLATVFGDDGSVGILRSHGLTNFVEYTGTWSESYSGKVFFSAQHTFQEGSTSYVTWIIGVGDANQLYGRISARGASSRFQMTRQAMPTP